MFTAMTAESLMELVFDGFGMVWFELALFAGTLVLAVLLKSVTSGKQIKTVGKVVEFTPSVSHDKFLTRPAQPYRAPQGGDVTRRAQGRSKVELSSDPSRVIDEVCQSVLRNAPARALTSALQMYQDLKATGMDKRLPEFERHSKHKVQEFYSTLVQCAVRTGQPNLVLELVNNMRASGVPRTRAFYESTMKMLAGKKCYREALAMYSEQEADRLEPSAVTCSCLVSFAVEVGELGRAVEFFMKLSAMERPSIRAYMTILRVYAKQQDWASSLGVLKDMRERGLEPDALVLNIVLGTCVNSGQHSQAESLLETMLATNAAAVDVVSFNTVIKGFAQQGELTKAFASLQKMAASGLTPNMITLNTVMDSAVRCKQPADAWRVVGLMRGMGLSPDKYSCSILVKGLSEGATTEQIRGCLQIFWEMDGKDTAQLRDMLFHSLLEASIVVKDKKLIHEILEYMRTQAVVLSPGTYNSLVKSLVASGDLATCLKLWDDMLASNITPHQITLATLTDACISSSQAERALKLFDGLKHLNGDSRSSFFATFVRALCKGKCMQIATRAYRDMMASGDRRKFKELDLATYTTLIKVQSEEGNLDAAIAMVDDVRMAGLCPDEAMLNAVLGACFHAKRLDLGERIFTDFMAGGARLNHACITTMVKLYGRCQRLEDAVGLVENMQSKFGLAPTVQTYTCLLLACVRNKQMDEALKQFREMKQRISEAPEVSVYDMLLNGCASAGAFAQGMELADEALKARVAVEVPHGLVTSALQKRLSEAQTQELREFVVRHKMTLSGKSRETLFAGLSSS